MPHINAYRGMYPYTLFMHGHTQKLQSVVSYAPGFAHHQLSCAFHCLFVLLNKAHSWLAISDLVWLALIMFIPHTLWRCLWIAKTLALVYLGFLCRVLCCTSVVICCLLEWETEIILFCMSSERKWPENSLNKTVAYIIARQDTFVLPRWLNSIMDFGCYLRKTAICHTCSFGLLCVFCRKTLLECRHHFVVWAKANCLINNRYKLRPWKALAHCTPIKVTIIQYLLYLEHTQWPVY